MALASIGDQQIEEHLAIARNDENEYVRKVADLVTRRRGEVNI
jgi:hypothetical protein